MCKDDYVHKILCIGKLQGQNNKISLTGKPNWNVKAFARIMLSGLELSLKPETSIFDGDNEMVVNNNGLAVSETIPIDPGIYSVEDLIKELSTILALYTGGNNNASSRDYQINHNGGLLEFQLSTFQREVQRLVTDWEVISGVPTITDTGSYTGVAGAEECQIATRELLPNAGFRFSGTVTLPRNFQVFLSTFGYFLVGVGVKGQGAALTTTITAPGTTYIDAVNVATTGGTGTGLTVDITTAAGGVTVVTINNAGTGYTAADVITITGGAADATFTVDTISAGLYNTTFDEVEIATAVAPLVGDTFVVVSNNDDVSIQVRDAAGVLRFAPRSGVMTPAIWFEAFGDNDAQAQWFVESDQSSVVQLTDIQTAHFQTDQLPSSLSIKFGANRLAKTLGFKDVGPWNNTGSPAFIRGTTALGQFFDIPSVSVVLSGGPFRIDGYQYSSNNTGQQRNVVATIINPTIDNTVLRYNAPFDNFVALNNAVDFNFTSIDVTFFNDLNGQPLVFIAPPVVAFDINMS